MRWAYLVHQKSHHPQQVKLRFIEYSFSLVFPVSISPIISEIYQMSSVPFPLPDHACYLNEFTPPNSLTLIPNF